MRNSPESRFWVPRSSFKVGYYSYAHYPPPVLYSDLSLETSVSQVLLPSWVFAELPSAKSAADHLKIRDIDQATSHCDVGWAGCKVPDPLIRNASLVPDVG